MIEGADIVRLIKAQRIKWLGAYSKNGPMKPARKLLDWKPMGIGPVERPRQRWQENVMEDLKKKKLKVKNWKETAKGRRTGRDLAEMAKNPQRVVLSNDDANDHFSRNLLFLCCSVFQTCCSSFKSLACLMELV